MITYDKSTKTVHMSLVDLEHCGFNHDDFFEELVLAGIIPSLDEKTDPTYKNFEDIIWPETLVVEFKNGAVKIGKEI
jgi:hypothetical protein